MLKKIRNFFSSSIRIKGSVIGFIGICTAVFITEQQYNQQRKAFYRQANLESSRLLKMRNDPTALYGKFRVDKENNMWVKPVKEDLSL